MNKVLVGMCTSVLFFAVTAIAQTTPADGGSSTSQGTQGASPSMSGQSGTGTPDATHSSTSGTMSGDKSSDSSMGMKGDKGSKKMKGCIQSQGGMYMLQTKHGKDVMLTGQDVSAHVGHEVAVHGMWAAGMSGMSKDSSGTAAATGKSFNVTSVDMISETCSMGKGKKNSMSGGSGMSGGSTSGTPTTPPQQ